jgi:hypothetical protein
MAQIPIKDELCIMIIGSNLSQSSLIKRPFCHFSHFQRLFEQLIGSAAFHRSIPTFITVVFVQDYGVYRLVGGLGPDAAPDQFFDGLADAGVT